MSTWALYGEYMARVLPPVLSLDCGERVVYFTGSTV